MTKNGHTNGKKPVKHHIKEKMEALEKEEAACKNGMDQRTVQLKKLAEEIQNRRATPAAELPVEDSRKTSR